ncbi:TetR/AcrR family transcriptional regulator [Acutalibacter muris]|uniref:TetR family transcriptional regulator n=1 Tax=Acutalibacter muris TaxID=1796620 RepID=A0A1Z2XRP7_9FIRM|nr:MULTISPECIES: TetR/AcrR family transcriptional regulator [Eubacteriales]ANU55654.1 TetR family transcriptional regulator [Hungateiclostridiaceae bacterium KB18]ASB41106.1 TetR family transcriptional regulator [Acutalibacter muris]QQR30378.1 TetR/AcrR family transcriptional regulator [Acutalibacter muris]
MGNKSNSFLSLQSKEWLVKALQILMKTKKYSDITIKELAQKAGVDRKTFYRNFKSKEDVLRFYLDRTCQDYIARLNKENKLTIFAIAKAFFSTCKQHSDFLILLDKNDLLPLLLIAFDDYLPMLHEMFEDKRIDDNPVYYSEYALSFFTGGFWNISIKWIRRGGHETPEEMAQIVETLMSYSI